MDDRDVRIRSNLNRAFAGVESHDLRRICRELGAHLLESDSPVQHTARVGERHQCLETGQPHRDLGPVTLPHRLLLAIECASVRRDDRYFSALESFPQALDIAGLLELRAAGVEMSV